MNISQQLEYCKYVVATRESSHPELLSQVAGSSRIDHYVDFKPNCLLDYATTVEYMKETGKDIMGMISLNVLFIIISN